MKSSFSIKHTATTPYSMITTFMRFVGIGVLNTLVDFLILNVLISLFGISGSHTYAMYKVIAFSGAVIHSYLWNKYWVFKSVQKGRGVIHEQTSFVLVSLVGLFVNVSVSSLVYTLVASSGFAFSTVISANIGAIIGSISVLLVNFFGYKFLVFRKAA